MPRDPKLEVSLLLMRLTLAAFMLVWAVDKVIAPDHAQAVFARYYFTDLSHQPLVIIGIVQIAVIAAFAAGFASLCRRICQIVDLWRGSPAACRVDGIDLCSAGQSLGGGAAGLALLGGCAGARGRACPLSAQRQRPALVGRCGLAGREGCGNKG